MTASFEDIADTVSIAEAAELVKLHPNTVRRAVTSGALPATLPGGADPKRTGRSAYRIKRADLLAWYSGQPVPSPARTTKPGRSKKK